MDYLRNGNLALAFAVELIMLAGFALAGWALSETLWVRLLVAVMLPALAIAAWWIWAAPRGYNRLKMPALGAFKIAIFALGVAAWIVAGQGFFAAVFGMLALINVLGMWAFRQW
jgi:hypothetical protein